jgi:site-specific recombinase XerD
VQKTQGEQIVSWCAERGTEPAHATETDLLNYRQHLAQHYGRGTVAVKLAAVRRLYQAAVWRGFRADNPAAGLKAPKERTERAEDGLRRLLSAPMGSKTGAVRDRAMLAMMGRHGLRVSEVAGLTVDSLDLDAGTVRVVGKGSKARTVYLTESSTTAIREWLDIRPDVANEGARALFEALDRRTKGSGMTARAIRWKVDKYLELTA